MEMVLGGFGKENKKAIPEGMALTRQGPELEPGTF
ncbi:hypothetical protein predicted by Glimmer/Critica [Bdellovibrio bacteriovorus HD100]|uniref:Uncharacterized protein n=1 Tax=Bdellovibrio bacteriovorus (strain ATCC 15356 / DSM 50701 / NCIMB 9529 / HD100) TaxID=264462 RepID=Q6MHJ0_BDEBA|nr:hypothetical protein predicted by Glimmer/Critica [Bdellovibrio bacteriovorus HD100]